MLRFPRRISLIFLGLSLGANATIVHPSPNVTCSLLAVVPTKEGGQPVAEVRFKGVPLFRFRVSQQGMTPLEKAAAAAARLQSFLEKRGDPSSLRLRSSGATSIFIAAPQFDIVQVTAEEARANRTSYEALAKLWLNNLQQCLNRPWLWAPPIIVPLGEEVLAPVYTNRPEEIRVIEFSAAVVYVRPKLGQGGLLVEGRSPGVTSVRVAIGEESTDMQVTVQRRAAQLLRAPILTLYGSSIQFSQLRRCLRAILIAAMDISPGARLGIDDTSRVPTYLTPATSSLRLPVRVDGEHLIPFRQDVDITLVWDVYPRKAVSALWVSNDPERVRKFGDLFSQELHVGEAVRFLFHHINAMDQLCELRLEVLNPSEETSRIAIVESSAGPTTDEIHAGHVACANYMRRERDGTGYLFPVPSRQGIAVFVLRLAPRQLASGLWQFINLGERDVIVQCRAVPVALLPEYFPVTSSALPGSHSPHVYPGEVREIEALHRLGSHWTFITIGDQKALSTREDKSLAGSYGIPHRVRLRMVNPGEQAETALLVFVPSGGAARGTFLVDGEWIETPTCSPPSERVLKKITVPPCAEVTTIIETMPESGSNYPVRLVVRPLAMAANTSVGGRDLPEKIDPNPSVSYNSDRDKCLRDVPGSCKREVQ